MMDSKEKLVENLEKQLETAQDESQEAFEKAPHNMDYKEFHEYMKPFNQKVSTISRLLRVTKTPTFENDIPAYGDIMSLKDFIENVKCGGFIDYDGSGNYVKDGKESDISIYPSDVKYGAIRTDFDTIVWYNR